MNNCGYVPGYLDSPSCASSAGLLALPSSVMTCNNAISVVLVIRLTATRMSIHTSYQLDA